ncbi:MAG: type II toxin-antitoxin system RelE/ParE family toxin [Rhizomicrobium sp.]
MTKVSYTERARLDLIEIGAFIDADSPRNADLFIAKLEAKANKIAQWPRIYTRRDDLMPGLRSAVLGKYLIFFRIVGNGIEVVRVTHGARDLKHLFAT